VSDLRPSKISSLHFSLAKTHLLKCRVHLITDVTAIHPFQGDICARKGSLRKMSLPSATNNKTKAREYELESECSSTAHRHKLARDTGEVRNGARDLGASLSLRGPGSILGNPSGTYGGQSDTEKVSSERFGFPLLVSFNQGHRFTYSFIHTLNIHHRRYIISLIESTVHNTFKKLLGTTF